MREVGIVVGVIVGLALVQVLTFVFETTTLLNLGLALIGSGLLLSVPAAVLYHLRLMQLLGPRGQLDKGWIWSPMRLHRYLRGGERVSVLAWFGLGVFGWVSALAGCGLVALSFFTLSL